MHEQERLTVVDVNLKFLQLLLLSPTFSNEIIKRNTNMREIIIENCKCCLLQLLQRHWKHI